MSADPTEDMRQHFEPDGSPRRLDGGTAGAHCAESSGSGFLRRRQRLYISENNMGAEKPPCIHEEYDSEAGATYLQISRMPVHRTREFRGLVLIDTDERGHLRGLEFVGDGPIDCPNTEAR